MEKFIGLIGLGYWGKNILRNLYELGVIHTACDTDPGTLEERKAKFPGLNYTASFGEMLKSPSIRAIAIAAPAAAHYALARQALLAGKDVFVEKPLSLTMGEGEELVRLAERESKILMVGHILQYHPAVTKLKELISSGELGKVQYIHSNRLNIGKLRTEENILWSFAPHDISVILMLLGEEPVRVQAFGGYYLNDGVYDTTLTALDFRNGVKGHIFVNWLHPYKEQKLIVVGSKAMAVFDDVSEEKLFIYPHKIEWKDGKVPVTVKAEPRVVPIGAGEPLKEELKHFIECVRERKRPRTDGEEGLRVLNVLTLAQGFLTEARPSRVEEKSKPYFAHESSSVDEGAEIGEGTRIWHYSHVLKGAKIGRNCVIGQNVMIGSRVTIGDRCKIQNNVSVYEGVVLEEEVFCGPSCVFTNVYNPRAFIERKHEFRKTLVQKGATIGANSTIVCGATIGKYAMIGSGAVIKSDVPDYAVVVGVPAEQIGWACRCGTTLKFSGNRAVCGYCGNEYGLQNNQFVIVKEKHSSPK